MNPKKEAMAYHKIAVLCTLLVDEFDKLGPGSLLSEKAKDMIIFIEEMYTKIDMIPEIRSGTYLSELTNKVDTVIRKNFQQIQ
jgi:hypothetical protein